MLLTFHIPIFDARRFTNLKDELILRPSWPSFLESSKRPFQKNLGEVRKRKGGGIQGWIGESYQSVVESSFKIEYDKIEYCDENLKLKNIFKRFYFDGQSNAKFEIGFFVDSKVDRTLVLGLVEAVIDNILRFKIRSRHIKNESLQMKDSGELVSKLFALGTIKGKLSPQKVVNHTKLVRAGKPLITISTRDKGNTTYDHAMSVFTLAPSKSYTVSSLNEHGKNEIFLSFSNGIGSFPTFFLHKPMGGTEDDLRNFRIVFSRLYVEFYCLQIGCALIDSLKNESMDDSQKSHLLSFLNVIAQRIVGKTEICLK